jgi:hypothetical protein
MVFFIVLTILFIFPSCSNNKENLETNENHSGQSTSELNGSDDNDDSNSMQTNNEENQDIKGESGEKETSRDSEDNDTYSLDASLKGEELLRSVKQKRLDNMKLEAKMVSVGATSQMVSYYDGDNTRTETSITNYGTSVLIHLPEDSVMYSYIEGETNGTKIIGADTDVAEEMGLIMDNTELFAEITDEISEDMSARVEMLGDEEVIYIEAHESEDDMGEGLVKMWYSVKYGIPLKYEFILGTTTTVEYIVTSVDTNIKIDKALFIPPAEVEFREIDADTMMDFDFLQ